MEPVQKTIEIKSGFYPSLVYLPTPYQLQNTLCIGIISEILKNNNIQHQSIPHLHISLTTTFHLLPPEISPFIAKLKNSLKHKKIKLPLILLLDKIRIIDNFITIQVK